MWLKSKQVGELGAWSHGWGGWLDGWIQHFFRKKCQKPVESGEWVDFFFLRTPSQWPNEKLISNQRWAEMNLPKISIHFTILGTAS